MHSLEPPAARQAIRLGFLLCDELTRLRYGVVTALYNVIWSYIGYNNANYSLSETKNPVRALKIAAPMAIICVSVLYMLVNVGFRLASFLIFILIRECLNPQIAYFAAVPREEIMSSGRILAASFFRNVFGPSAERALSVFVALSAFGNVLSVIFSQGRCKSTCYLPS